MDPLFNGITAIVALLVLLAAGVPVAFSMLLVGFGGLTMLHGLTAAVTMTGSIAYHSVSSWLYIVIPMFVLMGELAGESGLVVDMFSFFKAWIGRIPGSTAVVTLLTSSMFAFATGSSLAATAVMGRLALPEMAKHNYNKKYALETVLAGGTLGNMIPPSIGAVLYGIITENSIGKVLIALVIPGVLLSLLFVLVVIFEAMYFPDRAPKTSPASWNERWHSLGKVWGIIVVVIFVFGSIYSGVATITEAATIGAFGAFLVTMSMRRLTVVQLSRVLERTALLTGTILILIVSVGLFSRFLNVVGFSRSIIDFALSFNLQPSMILISVYIIFIFFGCLMDPSSLLFLTLPLVYPLIRKLGYDPIWFGVMSVSLVQIGFLTPPVGMGVWVLSPVADAPLETCFRASRNVLVVWLFLIALLSFFPIIATWLPSKMQ